MTYRYRAAAIQAVHFTGQRLADLPDWVRKYHAFSPEGGNTAIGQGATFNLLIPNGREIMEVSPDNWLVLDDSGTMQKMSPADFGRRVEIVDDHKDPEPVSPTKLPEPSPSKPTLADDAQSDIPADKSE